jgi:catechol 2,3-dioxygenase-like lactoylglutathione lyase family enzyme
LKISSRASSRSWAASSSLLISFFAHFLSIKEFLDFNRVSILNVFDHMGIYVRDLDSSAKYYHDLFGFTVHSRLNDYGIQIVFMDMGSALLQLKQSNMPSSPGHGKYNHFAVHTDDYDGFIKKLYDRDISYWEMSLGPGKRLVYFTDPNGHDIEVCESPFRD